MTPFIIALILVAGGGVFVGYRVGRWNIEVREALARSYGKEDGIRIGADAARADAHRTVMTVLAHYPTSTGGRRIAKALGMDPGPLPRTRKGAA